MQEHKACLLTSGLVIICLLACGCQGPGNIGPHQLRAKAIQIVTSGLVDPDPRIRATAIEVVATTGQEQFAQNIISLIHDPVVPVRFAALMAVGDMQYRPAFEQVKQLFDQIQEDTNVRLAASYALVRLGASPYIEYPRRMISSSDQTVRANAAMILGRLRDRQSLDPLYWALQDKASDEVVLMQAMESIAMLGDRQIYNKIWAKLISAYADDRITAIRAMGALGTAQARDALKTCLEDEVLEVRLAAAAQLGTLGDRSGKDVVRKAIQKGLIIATGINLHGGQAEMAKVLCALAIGQIGSADLASYLPTLIEDRSRLVQLYAARAVLQLSDTSSLHPTYTTIGKMP